MKVYVYLHKDGFLTQYDHELNNDEKMMMFGNGKITLIGLQDLPIEPAKKEVVKSVQGIVENDGAGGQIVTPVRCLPPDAYDVTVNFKVKE